MSVLLAAIYIVFTAAVLLTVWRIIVGPSILDRAVAADVLLTLVICILGADMATGEAVQRRLADNIQSMALRADIHVIQAPGTAAAPG